MGKAKILSRFLGKVTRDGRLLPSHQSLCVALICLWDKSGFDIPFRISRRELMRMSKIGSTSTYHKCLQDLIRCGYLNYEPSYDPCKGSLVFFK